MNIGSVIMSKRKALGYTQQTLADKLNVSFQAVSKWENGTNYPEMEMLPMIASVLDTSIDFLLGYKSFVISEYYDIIFSSGVYHFIKSEIRKEISANLKEYTNKNGIHAINVFVDKPFVEVPPDKDVNRFRWNSGELFMLYHDWKLHKTEEIIFNCNSGGIPHQHCMDIMIAERVK